MSELKVTVLVAVLTVSGGLVGALITSLVQNEASKRVINLQVVDFLAKEFLKEKSLMLQSGKMSSKDLNGILQHKETAFIARQLTEHLTANHDYVDFRALEAALSGIERRYSYAQLYQEAGLAEVLCENLELGAGDWPVQITNQLSKCGNTELEGLIIELIEIDQPNYRFQLALSNDRNRNMCRNRAGACKFWIDLGDRIESTPYQYLILAEYIGYKDPYDRTTPVAVFSIVKRIRPVVGFPSPMTVRDASYWEYELPTAASKAESGEESCAHFFDIDRNTPAQPNPPDLDTLDKAVLRACGPIRGRVSEEEFNALVNDHYKELSNTFPTSWADEPRDKVTDRLRRIWLGYRGLDHVMCGEWEARSVMGLHFRGRYLQLQRERAACYENSDAEEIVNGHIYTIGVRSADRANRNMKKGYGLQQSAADIFRIGHHAYELCASADDGWKPYSVDFDKAVYVKTVEEQRTIDNYVICKASASDDTETYGILTIYPDATPTSPHSARMRLE